MSDKKNYIELSLDEKMNCVKLYNTHLRIKPRLYLCDKDMVLLDKIFEGRSPNVIMGIFNILRETKFYSLIVVKQTKERKPKQSKQPRQL